MNLAKEQASMPLASAACIKEMLRTLVQACTYLEKSIDFTACCFSPFLLFF